MLEIISDVLLGVGALAAAAYCFVLSRRLRKLNSLQNGMGGAVAVLSAQVDDMTKTLEKAREAAGISANTLSDLTSRAEASSNKLELMMASLHDLPDQDLTSEAPEPDQPAQEPKRPESAAVFSTHRRLEAAQ